MTGRYHVITWGCQMNEEDSEQIGLYLEQMGYQLTDRADDADVVMLNTCSVRAKPEEKVWSQLGRLRDIKRERPDLLIGVCGCMAQVEHTEIARRAPYVNLIVGTGNIAEIPDMIRKAKSAPTASTLFRTELSTESPGTHNSHVALPSFKAPAAHRDFIPLTSLALPPRKGAVVADVPDRVTRRRPKLKAHVPIMYGCDKFCTFCIVPFTRGRERSRPSSEVLAEIEAMARCGTREVTLLGQTVNSYGKNMPEGRIPFCDLLEQINAIRGIQRIRFTSPYPRDFTDDLIEAIGRLEHVCEHVHLPLQVGDDTLLADMHRGYTVERYCEIVETLRARVPGIAITTDLMLGYPGETDAQYENTMRLVEKLRFDAAFMFSYSPRPNTKAALREDQIPKQVKVHRLSALIALQNGITCEINASQMGQIAEVLVEGFSLKDRSRLTGYTRTLKSVNIALPPGGTRSAESLIGKLVPVRLVQSHLTGFTGEVSEMG